MLTMDDLYSSLVPGQKVTGHRAKTVALLDQYRKNLKREYCHRNFDKDVLKLAQKYLRSSWRKEFKDTVKYLADLKSSEDGLPFCQGAKDYGKLRESALKFARPNHTYFGWNKFYRQAKEIMLKEFSKLYLRPLHYESDDDIMKFLPRKDTHAGFTYLLSGKKEKGENLEDIFNRFTKEVSTAIELGSFRKPLLVAVRTQGNGHAFTEDGKRTNDCSHKTRMVSMVDLMVILAELIFSRPMQDYMAGVSWYAGGKDVDTHLANIISTMRRNYKYWITLDYSSYDASISAWLIHDAFDIMRSAFKLSPQDASLFDVVERDFIEKNFVLGDEIVHSVRGVPSGSMFTSIVDSIVNRLMITTYLLAKGIEGEMVIMGDDNHIETNVKIEPDDIASYLTKNFGIEVNPLKCKNGTKHDDPEFLSVYWTVDGRYREPHEIIAKLLYPERYRQYGKGKGSPELTFYSYLRCYPVATRDVWDIARFKKDYPNLSLAMLDELGSHYMPGSLAFMRKYTRRTKVA